METPALHRSALYRTIWRWHFYAGLLVIPFILVLATTGAFYLFKPQVERWEERAFQGFPTTGAVGAEGQVRAALASLPNATFSAYRLPRDPGDAAMVHLALPHGAMRDVFVSPQGKVVGSLDPERRIMEIDQKIHGQLLLGKGGSWLVELAASWAIVMVLTGLYLWWPRGNGLAGVVWPRLSAGGRTFWRDVHAVAGFWVAGLALVLLTTGMPWADVWGSGFKWVRAEMGWTRGVQDWTIGGLPPEPIQQVHAEHDHAAMMRMESAAPAMGTLDAIVAKAQAEHLAFPVMITPPGMKARFDMPATQSWTVRSDAQNRPLRTTIEYDAVSGRELTRETFADKHPIDRVVGYGVAWHEGQLFGWVNQLIGLITAALLITLAVSGFVMWRKRKPDAALGAPPLPPVPAKIGGVAVILIGVAAVLPLLAGSLVVLWLVERLILARIPGTRSWLGLAPA